MTNELSTERAIEALYTVRAYYASLTAGYPKGKDCRGIGDVMCSEIANSCLMAIKALEQTGWIPVSERLPKAGEYIGDVAKYYLVQNEYGDMMVASFTHSEYWEQIYQLKPIADKIVAWMPLPQPYTESEDKK